MKDCELFGRCIASIPVTISIPSDTGFSTNGDELEALALKLAKIRGSAAWSLVIGGKWEGADPGDSGGVDNCLE